MDGENNGKPNPMNKWDDCFFFPIIFWVDTHIYIYIEYIYIYMYNIPAPSPPGGTPIESSGRDYGMIFEIFSHPSSKAPFAIRSRYMSIWMFPKIGFFNPPNHPFVHRVWFSIIFTIHFGGFGILGLTPILCIPGTSNIHLLVVVSIG